MFKFFFVALFSLVTFCSVAYGQSPDLFERFFLLKEDFDGLRKNTLVEVTEESDFKLKIQVYRHSFENGRHERQPAFTREMERKDFFKKFYNAPLVVGPNNEAVLLHPSWTDKEGSPRRDYIIGGGGEPLFCPPPVQAPGIQDQVESVLQHAERQASENSDLRRSVEPEDFFVVSNAIADLIPNTLVQVVKEDQTHISLAVYKFRQLPNGFAREVIDEVRIPLQDFRRSFAPATVEKSGEEFIFIHPFRVDEEGVPRRETIRLRRDLATPPAETPQSERVPSSREAPNLSSYQQVRTELEEDLNWFFNQVDHRLSSQDAITIKEGLKAPSQREIPSKTIAGAHARLLSSILEEAERDARFQGEHGKERASRLFAALTIYGEFRRRDRPSRTNPVVHRSLPHLFWAYQTMKNRLPKQHWGDQVQKINARYDSSGRASRKFSESLVPIVLASYQYSAWNPGDSNLSAILLADNGSPFRDITDVIAGVDTGVIGLEPGKADPKITHYISPASLESGRKPSWWVSDRFVLLSARDLPRVVRSDQVNKNSVESAPNATFEYYVDPRWFEGAREER